jgi:hypothetical protein
MVQLSVSGLENQILDNLSSVSSASNKSQNTQVQYAFRDFVNYFLELQSQAEIAARLKQASQPQAGLLQATSPKESPALQAAALHLNVQMERHQVDDIESFNGQNVRVTQLKTDQGLARRIEVITPQDMGNGTLSYAVTVIKLAVQTNLGSTPTVAQTAQVSSLPIAQASASSGGQLQDFLNRSPYAKPGEALMEYEEDNAMNLLKAEAQWRDLQQEKHVQALINAALELVNYLQEQEYRAAFGLNKDELDLIKKALEKDPAEVGQAALVQFIKKKRIALEMLRKELQQRMELQEQSAQTAAAFAQVERMQNFYNGAKKVLEVQQIEKGKLQQLMGVLEQLNMSLSQQDISPIAGIA